MIQTLKQHHRELIVITFGGLFLFTPLYIVFAQSGGFVPLTRIPGIDPGAPIGDFFNQIFRLGHTAAAILAVAFIAYGGIEYMTTDSISKKSSGKERIQNAILGLIIALLIWVVLYTLNPNLLNFNFTPPPTGGDTSAIGNFSAGKIPTEQGALTSLQETAKGKIGRSQTEDTTSRETEGRTPPPTERQKRAQSEEEIASSIKAVPVQCRSLNDPLSTKICIDDVEREEALKK